MPFNVGDAAPDFQLPNAHPSLGGPEMGLSDVLTDKGAIVVFSCLHCPYVVGNIGRIDDLANRASQAGLGFVAINSNAANPQYLSDSAANTRAACEKGIPYPFLIDGEQSDGLASGERTWVTLDEGMRRSVGIDLHAIVTGYAVPINSSGQVSLFL